MLHILIFDAFLIGSCSYAFWCGRRDSQLIAATCVVATLATNFLMRPMIERFSGVEVPIFAIDLAAFASFTLVALRSPRFWPLWVAGLQLTTVSAHVMKQIQEGLMARVYSVAEQAWSYPILLILVIGTWRSMRRDACLPLPARKL